MKDTNNIETMLSIKNQHEAEEILALLKEFSQEEKMSFLAFIQGARFAKSVQESA